MTVDHFTRANEGTYTVQIHDGKAKTQSSLVLVGDGEAFISHFSLSQSEKRKNISAETEYDMKTVALKMFFIDLLKKNYILNQPFILSVRQSSVFSVSYLLSHFHRSCFLCFSVQSCSEGGRVSEERAHQEARCRHTHTHIWKHSEFNAVAEINSL